MLVAFAIEDNHKGEFRDILKVPLGYRGVPVDNVDLANRDVLASLEQREQLSIDELARTAPLCVEVDDSDLACTQVIENLYVFAGFRTVDDAS